MRKVIRLYIIRIKFLILKGVFQYEARKKDDALKLSIKISALEAQILDVF